MGVSSGTGTLKWLRYREFGEQLLSPSPPYNTQPQKMKFEASFIYMHSLLQDRMDLFFHRGRGAGPLPKDLFCSFDLSSAEFGVASKSTDHVCGGDVYQGEF